MPRMRVTLFSLGVGLVLSACPAEKPPAPVVEKPVEAVPPPPPPLDAAQVLAAITENVRGVDVSLQVKSPHEVGIEVSGGGSPAIALSLLGSLSQRLPNTRISKMQLDENAWKASLTTSSVETPDDPTSLDKLIAAARPVFGDPASPLALLSTGSIDVTSSRVAFKGTLAQGKTIADAGLAIAPGFALTKVDGGPPFVLEISPAVAPPTPAP
jgi:hypothetical protein